MTYLPKFFGQPWGPHHRWVLDEFSSNGPVGLRDFEGAPRGSGKSTLATVGLPLAAIARGTHRFVVLVRYNQTIASAALKIIRDELDRRPELAEENPNLAYVPGRKLERATDRMDEVQLQGGRIVALGAGQSIRGLLRRSEDGELIRPDLVLLDDLEDPAQVRSKLQTDRLEEWVFADISGLQGPGSTSNMDVFGIGTTIDMDALATRMLEKRGRFEGWNTERFPAESGAGEERRAMWVGLPLERLDQLKTPGTKDFVGLLTYAAEYLLNPQARGDAQFKREWLQWGHCPEGLRFVAIGVDPAASQKTTADFSAVVVVGIDPKDDLKIWVKKAWCDRVTMDALFDRIEAEWREAGPEARVAYEAVAGFAWGVQELRKRRIPNRPVTHMADKVSRSQSTSLLYESRWVWHDYSLKDGEFEGQLLMFPTGPHDDMVDAAVHAMRLCTLDGRRIKAS